MFTVPSGDWSLLQLIQFFGPRIFFAILCGGIIGLERELKNKPAGLKTNIMICLGAALYSSVSVLNSLANSAHGYYGDPSRISAQIVSGIGFLGGGTIIQARGTILGLTTAATIWIVAAIGICIGVGHSDLGVLASISVLLVLVGTNLFEDRVLGRSLTFALEIVAEDPQGSVRMSINHAMAQNNLILDDFDLSSRGNDSIMNCRYNGHRGDHKKFVLELWSTPGIKEVKQV
jgi:putative Mg2+ transporter-C (MgtC) family protein